MDELTAEELEMILNSGNMESSAEDAMLQLAMLQKLRGGMAPMEGRQVGQMYVPNNPLEHLARAMEINKMNQKERQIEEAFANSRSKEREGLMKYGMSRMARQNAMQGMGDPTQQSMEANVPMPDIQMQMAQQLRQRPPTPPPVAPGPPRRGRTSRDFLLGQNF